MKIDTPYLLTEGEYNEYDKETFPHRYVVCDGHTQDVLFSTKTVAEAHAAALVILHAYDGHKAKLVIIDTDNDEPLDTTIHPETALALSKVIQEALFWWPSMSRFKLLVHIYHDLKDVGVYWDGNSHFNWADPMIMACVIADSISDD